MLLRKAVANVIFFSAFVGLGILALLGNWMLASVFIVTVVFVVSRHIFSICPRCSNFACGFNPRGKNISSSAQPEPGDVNGSGFSNLPTTRTTVLPFLITGPFAAIAAWIYSPVATVILFVIILIAHSIFSKITCSHCENDCVGNCNEEYKDWKAARNQPGASE
jgi:hypothetical protein